MPPTCLRAGAAGAGHPQGTSATWLSTSAPTPKMPGDGEDPLGRHPAKGGEAGTFGQDETHPVAVETLRRLGPPPPQHYVVFTGLQAVQAPPSIWAWRMSSLGQRAGSIPARSPR